MFSSPKFEICALAYTVFTSTKLPLISVTLAAFIVPEVRASRVLSADAVTTASVRFTSSLPEP